MKTIHISVDGLPSSKLNKFINGSKGFKKFISEGLITYNARADPSSTLTLPNHTSMFTSMFVKNHKINHNYDNKDIEFQYDNIFDLLKRNNLTSAMYVGKNKFNMFKSKVNYYYIDKEYPPKNGYPSVVRKFIKDTGGKNANSCNLYDYTFIHFMSTDYAGHTEGWDSEEYDDRLKDVDLGISKILKLVDIYKNMCKIVVILTSDHGGTENNHGDNENPENFNIPFFVYYNYKNLGGKNLYSINPDRLNPSYGVNPSAESEPQCIRNHDIGNLVAQINDIGYIEGSTMGIDNKLNIDK